MRTFLSRLSALLCCVLFTGAAGFDAPLMQSSDFYVNDHAGVIEQRERVAMLEQAIETYEKTGVRVVVLTVESLDGLEPADYAGRIFDSWQLGEIYGVKGSKGILILLCTEERHIVAVTNTDVPMKYPLEKAEKLAAAGALSDAVSVCFFSVADEIDGNNQINGGAETIFIEPERLYYDADKEPDNKQGNARREPEKQKLDKNAQLAVMIGLFGLVIFTAVVTHKKSKRIIAGNAYFYGSYTYKRAEHRAPIKSHDYDDYPSGFGGAGNRKAIYGEDLDEADDICIIKRDKKAAPDAEGQDEV